MVDRIEKDVVSGAAPVGDAAPAAPADPDVAPVAPEELDAARELCEFIAKSPSMFHSNRAIRDRLEAAGFMRLSEADAWYGTVEAGGRYYVERNNSSVVAFKVGADLLSVGADGAPLGDYRFQMAAAHGDSPTYKVKSVPELEGPDDYLRLDVEAYGGMIDSTWFDRPLSLAGRVLVREGDALSSRLVAFDRDLLVIPSVAIHFNREVNDGYKFNRQVDLCPLFSAGRLQKGAFDRMLAAELGCQPEQILGRDLFLVNRTAPRVWGWDNEFVGAPKLDDLMCAFVALKGFLAADNPRCVTVYACFDNEEVGSNTKQGAMSTFLHDALRRLNAALGKTDEDYYRAVAKSFLVSCDNVHAVHPNHADKTDEVNCAHLNRGVVLKEAASQKYTTDAFSRAVFAGICADAGVPVQTFANRSDSAGGSTLGNLSNTQVSVHACDIGLPQLAMHSSYETAGVKDVLHGIRALSAFYACDLSIDGADGAIIG